MVAAQAVQMPEYAAPVLVAKWPAGQLTQPTLPLTPEYVPAAQFVQALDPAAEYMPALHAVHALAPLPE